MTEFQAGAALQRTKGAVERAAAMVPCHPAMIAAFIDVEAGGTGYYANNMLKVLPEPHWLYRLLPTGQRNKALMLGLAIKSWSRSTYRRMFPTAMSRYDYLNDVASRWGKEIAVDTASWGAGQVMGFNAEKCGYGSAVEMYDAFAGSEDEQIIAIVKYLIRSGGRDELQREDCQGLARIYNGSGQVAIYAPRLEEALKRRKRQKWQKTPNSRLPAKRDKDWIGMGDSGAQVKVLQEQLVALGYFVEVDGDFGPATRRAVRNFQHDRGLKVDGYAGSDTMAELIRAKPVPAVYQGNPTEREEATGDDLLAKGSSTVRRARQGKLTNVVTGSLAGAGAIGSVIEAGETAQSNAERAGGLLEWILPNSLSGYVVWIMAVVAGLSIIGWIVNNKIERRRVEEHRRGKNLSIGG